MGKMPDYVYLTFTISSAQLCVAIYLFFPSTTSYSVACAVTFLGLMVLKELFYLRLSEGVIIDTHVVD